MQRILIFTGLMLTLACYTSVLPSTEITKEFPFHGLHYLGEFRGCDPEALSDYKNLRKVMSEGIKGLGVDVQILNEVGKQFRPQGLTHLFLISTSHASIHTYPEHNNSAFLDLFTCGDNFDLKEYHQALVEFLKPESSSYKIIERGNIKIKNKESNSQ